MSMGIMAGEVLSSEKGSIHNCHRRWRLSS